MGKKLNLRQNWNNKTDTIVESDTIGEATISESSGYISYRIICPCLLLGRKPI